MMSDEIDDSEDRSPPLEPAEEPGPPTDTCNAKTADGTPCGNAAGYKTWHVGEGRCTYHGGGPAEREDDGRIRHGLYSKIAQTEDGARVGEIIDRDEAPTDGMRAAAAMMRLVAEKFLSQHVVGRQEVDPDTLEQAQKVLDRVSLASTRLSKAEDRRSVEPEKVTVLVKEITRIVREKADPETAAEIGRELQGEVIEAEIVED